MKEKHQRLTVCPNCQTELGRHDHFCRNCGQENHDLKVPFKHLFLEVLEGFLHLDGKSYRTAKALVLKPGFLTDEFRLGKRASYVPPIRLYVFISFVFFLILSLTSGGHDEAGSKQAEETPNTLKFTIGTISSKDLRGFTNAQIDSALDASGMEKTGISRYLTKQLGRMAAGSQAEVNHMLIKGVSYMMFVLMPYFALLLLIFYRRASEYYLNCLVFSIHFHAFAFLCLTVLVLIGKFIPLIYLVIYIPLFLGIYLWLALRTVYDQGRWVTTFKTAIIGFLHLLGLLAMFMVTVLISIILF